MKRIFVWVLLLPFLLMAFSCKKEKKVEREGIINFLTGTVTIFEGANRTSASVGTVVKQGMKIETGDKSFVDIYFDENAIKILENSSVEVKDLVFNMRDESEMTGFYIKKGKIFARVAKKLSQNSRFFISSPTTTAGVRGTEFLVASDELKSLVATLNGTVEVTNDVTPDQEPVLVKDKQQVIVEKDRPMSVQDLSAENRKLIDDIKKNFQEMKRSLREQFEKQREEIRKVVEEQRQKNRDMLEERRAIDKENVEKQKELDRKNINRIKGDADTTGAEAQEEVNRARDESQKNLEGVKPEIPKFKSTVE